MRSLIWLLLLALPVSAETLHEAASRGDMIRVIQILDGGADLNKLDGNGNTPLFVAVDRKQTEIVKYLLTRKADVNKSHPLTQAVMNNDLGLVRLLVEAGARVDAAPDEVHGPLEVAVINANLPVTRFLLSKGARATIKTQYGNLLHNISHGRGESESGQKGRLEIARLLVAHKVNPKQRDVRGDLPFHSALNAGHSSLVDYFLGLGIKADDQGSMAYTPLLVASETGDALMVEVLLRHKASLKAVSPEGSTALHKAAWNGHRKVVELLLRAGASPTAKNKAGKTPIDLARARGHKQLVQLMKAR